MSADPNNVTASPEVVQSQAAAAGTTWRPSDATPQPPAQGEDTGPARLAYAVARGELEHLRAFAEANKSEAGTVADQIVAAEKRENDLAIKAGLRSPPAKYQPAAVVPGPPGGWFRPELADLPPENPDPHAFYRRTWGKEPPPDIAEASRRETAARRQSDLEERHRNYHVGKAVAAAFKAGLDELQRNPHYFGPDQQHGLNKHLASVAERATVPPFKPLTWLERAPAASVPTNLITAKDVSEMSPGMKEAYRRAINREVSIDPSSGMAVEDLGPFRLSIKTAEAPEPSIEVNGRKFAKTPR